MNILFVAAEVFPFSKVGGLGDVMGALPQAIAHLGHHVRVVTPAYGTIDRTRFAFQKKQVRFKITIGSQSYPCHILSYRPRRNGNFEVFLVENETCFASRAVYTDVHGRPYPDNPTRFLLLSLAALELCQSMNWSPDIIHCHDNHSAWIPVYLRNGWAERPIFRSARTLLTLHNIAYQGTVDMSFRTSLALPDDLFWSMGALEWYDQINPLKGGLILADGLNTVSPTHAREIMDDETLSAGLKNILHNRPDPVEGILNGVDYHEWNPHNDPHTGFPYDHQNLAGKKKCKQRLLNELGLPAEALRSPLIGVISRLVEQKGITILTEALRYILESDAYVVILGSGEEQYHETLRQIADRFPQRIRVELFYNPELSHLILAGSDLFLMPSRFEPCGITQMLALRYGTVPVVRKTGGLADTVSDWDGRQGTGFVFEEYSGAALLQAVQRAQTCFRNQRTWKKLMIAGMQQDFSWDRSAREYEALYRRLFSRD